MSWIAQTSSQLLETFASERRRVFGRWRAWIYCRRFSLQNDVPLPDELALEKVIRAMLGQRKIAAIPGAPDVYVVTVPFANLLPMSDEVIIQEANPASVISHRSAMAKQRLTTWVPNEIHVTRFDPPDPRRIPLGTTPDDWVGMAYPKGSLPKRVNAVPVTWTQTAGKWDFGWEIGWAEGLPVYQTDLERTLLDILRAPEKGGGIGEVIDAWETGLETANVGRLIEYTERFDSPIIRQRVGFLMEAFGITHPSSEAWREHLQRGGSLKLVADAPYAATYSARWNLSINLPKTMRDRFPAGGIVNG